MAAMHNVSMPEQEAPTGKRSSRRQGGAAATSAVRQAILDGEFSPGQRLVEADLCAGFGITRGAARAALVELIHEGLVERVANQSARVRVIPLDEAVAILECRMQLEVLCASSAAHNGTEDEIAELRGLGDRLAQAVAEANPAKYSAINHELHRAVWACSRNSVAESLLRRLNSQMVRHQFQLAFRAGRPETSLAEHVAIIEAIARRDEIAAADAVREHLRSVIAALRASQAKDG
jgi:DNA-binding GntR family transcriptional regulator